VIILLECANGALLRAPKPADADALAKHANNHEVWLNLRDRLPHPYSVDDARGWIDSIKEQSPRVQFSIDVNGEVVGGIGLVLGEDIERCSAEVGYWVGQDYWNRGIATAALERICRYGFEELGLLRIFATPIAWNPASVRVLEKAGFQCEGVMRNACVKDGKVADMILYARVVERHRTLNRAQTFRFASAIQFRERPAR
jgi:[ribosomal protein S5]-alanine N-acetyltransferase